MLDKILLELISKEPDTTIPEADTDVSYWDTMSDFANVDTDFFSISVLRTF